MKSLPASHDHTLQGIAFVAAAVAFFAALDTTTKAVSLVVPLVMAVWFRYAFQVVATAAMLLPRQGLALLHTRHPWLQLLRGLLLMTTSSLAFVALKFTPVGEFTAIIMLTPLLITVLAAVSLHEHVSLVRWLLVLGGFAGAMMVIRPGHEMFDWASLLPLALVVLLASFQIITGKLARVEDAGTTHFYTGLVGAVGTGLALPFFWATPTTWGPWAALLAMGLFGTVGHLLLIHGYARAPVATLTPYLYLQVGFATLAGWLVFSHVPDAWAIAGIVAISACGAAGTWLTAREHKGRREPAESGYLPPEAEAL